jgi:hypothetical protein
MEGQERKPQKLNLLLRTTIVEDLRGPRKFSETHHRGTEGTEIRFFKYFFARTLCSLRLCGEFSEFFGCGAAALGTS